LGYIEKLEAKRCKLPFATGQDLPEYPNEEKELVGSLFYYCECGAREGGRWVAGKFVPVPHAPKEIAQPQRKRYPGGKR
jgi:hypothetical protein